LTWWRAVSSDVARKATSGQRSRPVVTSAATVSSRVSSPTARALSSCLTCDTTVGRRRKSLVTTAATSQSLAMVWIALTFS
jgi:hypothetical protein